jgi:hypothetical protein
VFTHRKRRGGEQGGKRSDGEERSLPMDNKVVIICPLRRLAYLINHSGIMAGEELRCAKKCAWYDDEHKCCAILTLATKEGQP